MTLQTMSELDRIFSEPLSSVLERERTAFDRLLEDCGNRIVLFGAGNLGCKALACLRTVRVEPLAFADNGHARWGTQVDGVPVLSPKEAAERYGASALFVVTIWSLGHFYAETRLKLETMGCLRIAPTAQLRWKFADRLLPDYCNDLPHKVYQHAPDVHRAASIWSDDCSRQEYLNQVRWRALGDLNVLGPPVSEKQYFLESLYRIKENEIFIDCGAYTGDTAEQVIQRSPAFSRIVAIEADPKNFERLTKWIATLDAPLFSRIHALRVAVSSQRGELRFQASGDEAARLTAGGDVVVECVSLDDLLTDEAPTFIKMDIEGAELDALAGARRTIERERPILAVCVYHKQDDLWRVPLFIRDMDADYRFYLRPHEGDGKELVCYAVPEHRLRKVV